MKQSFRKSILSFLAVIVLLLGAVAFSACAPKEVTLTFNTNGGSEIAPITAQAGTEITPPANPTKDGFVFAGWYLTASADGEKVTIPTVMPEKSTTYYAGYTEVPKATLTLDAAQGSIDTTTYQIAIGANVAAAINGKVPTASGLTFGGWFLDNGRQLSDTQTMPAGGLKLTARYKVDYTVEVLLQATEGDSYTVDASLGMKGSDWVGTTINRSALSLTAPQGYRFNSVLSTEISLTTVAADNVYRVYYDRATYNIFYLGNEPQGATATGTMERETVRSGAQITVKESAYKLEGYRFAGWATSSTGDIVYQPGEEIVVESNVQLFACWNFGMSDTNGGADKIYLLAEQPGKVLLDRSGLENKYGDYNEQTRIFTFAVNANKKLMGRVSADGLTFTYIDSSIALEYREYDRTTGTVKNSSLELDIEGTAKLNNGSSVINGTYESYADGYRFVPNGEGETFYFILDERDGKNVYIVSDGYDGYYLFMNNQGSINYPILALDGFGGARYAESASSTVIYCNYTVEDDVIRVAKDDDQMFLCMVKTVETTTGTTANVYVTPDEYRGQTFTAKSENGTVTLKVDGFGNATYIDETGTEYEAIYQIDEGYSLGESQFIYILYLYEVGDTSELNAIRYDVKGIEESVVDDSYSAYSEYNATSGFTARIRIKGETATIEFLMGNKTYRSVISGTCIADPETKGRYTFTATNIEEQYIPETYREVIQDTYGAFTFGLFTSNNKLVFVIEDKYVGTYSYTNNGSKFTLVCNGYGVAQFTIDQNDPVSVNYSVMEGYTEGENEWAFIGFTVNSVTYIIRVDLNGIGVTTYIDLSYAMNNTFSDLSNRISEYEETMRLYPDGTAIISVNIDGEYIPVVVGKYTPVTGKENFYTFTAAEALAKEYACYQTFVFTCVSQSTRAYYFCLYNESEILEITQGDITLSLNGYGIAMYQETQYLYSYDKDGMLILVTPSGSQEVHIRLKNDNTAFDASGAEMGTFYGYVNGMLSLEEYIIELDGFGVAYLYQYIEGDEEAGTESETILLGEGTYTVNGKEYALSIPDVENGSFEFTVGRISILGFAFPVYVKADETRVIEYTIAGGGSISVDRYNNVVYTDAEGTETTIIIQVLKDAIDLTETPRTILVVYTADGTKMQAIYAIGENNVLDKLDEVYGTYRQLIGAGISGTSFLLLDGKGGATLVGEENTVIATGKYVVSQTVENNYEFISETEGYQSFTFALTSVTSTEGTSFAVFKVYNKEWKVSAVSDSWEVLTLDGYGTATLIGEDGVVQMTYYTASQGENGTIVVGLYNFTTMEYTYYIVDVEAGSFQAQ